MNNSKKLTLIQGTFNAEEANEILMNIFNAKIKFHSLKNFSSEERFGTPDATAEKRIPELKESMDQIRAITAEAKANNKPLIIQSEIKIFPADE